MDHGNKEVRNNLAQIEGGVGLTGYKSKGTCRQQRKGRTVTREEKHRFMCQKYHIPSAFNGKNSELQVMGG